MGRAILFIGLVSSSIIEAVRPVVSNNEWTPVTNSQRVYLSPEVLARYRQQEAQDRYEVVNVNEGSDYVEDVETGDVTENIIIIQEEQEFEAQKVSSVQEITDNNNNNQYEKDEETPIIVYPEGTPGQPDYNPDPPAPVFPSPEQQQQPSPSLPYAPRRPPPPPPPQFNRRPVRPQNNNYRRPLPPPPAQRPPPSKYLPALSRNAQAPPSPTAAQSPQEGRPPPPPPEGVRPRPPPSIPRRPPLPPRNRPRPPPSGLIGGLKCSAEKLASDIKLSDEAFVRSQLDCVLDQGPCDELGSTLKRLAPDIMKGRCPPPCDRCKKEQIQKVMSKIAREYPKEWNQMVRQLGK